MTALVVWGCGELGGRVARGFASPVIGVTATPKRHDELRADNIEPRLPDLVVPPEVPLLVSTPGSARQAEAIRHLAHQGRTARTVLVSSTAALKDGPRADAARAAEAAFRAWASDGVILRFAGLYRPGRGPVTALLRRGHPPDGPANRVLGLIHYDDAATACLAALTRPDPEPMYVCLTQPSPTRQAFYEAACAHHGLPAPRFTDPVQPVPYDATAHMRDLVPEPAWPDWHAALE